MKSFELRCAAAATLLALASASAPAQAQAWTIVDLGRAGNIGTAALNDQGWVVFGNQVFAPGPGGYTSTALFSSAGGANNFALHDINNANAVVGRDYVNGGWRGFVWQDGVRTDLPSVANYTGTLHGWANGINDNGQVVGNAGDYATIWSPDGTGGYSLTTLGWYWNYPSTNIGSGNGVALNNAGVGLMATVYNTQRPGYTTGLGSPITILGAGLIDGPVGVAINDGLAVVGNSRYNCGGYSCWQPFVWQGTGVTSLPAVPAAANWPSTGEARALNESLAVVGHLYYGPYDARATMWLPSAGGWSQIDLNAQRPSDSVFWHLSDALDINESGQIVGLGQVNFEGDVHVFLLTPVPEPATWLLMALGAVGLALRRLGWPGTPPDPV